MRLPAMRDIGVSRAYQCALIETMDELIAAPGVAGEVARRAQWLKWAIEGREPGTEPLEFIVDAPPLVPEPLACSPKIASTVRR